VLEWDTLFKKILHWGNLVWDKNSSTTLNGSLYNSQVEVCTILKWNRMRYKCEIPVEAAMITLL